MKSWLFVGFLLVFSSCVSFVWAEECGPLQDSNERLTARVEELEELVSSLESFRTQSGEKSNALASCEENLSNSNAEMSVTATELAATRSELTSVKVELSDALERLAGIESGASDAVESLSLCKSRVDLYEGEGLEELGEEELLNVKSSVESTLKGIQDLLQKISDEKVRIASEQWWSSVKFWFFTLVIGYVGFMVAQRKLSNFPAPCKPPKNFSYIVPNSACPGSGDIHRHPLAKEGLVRSVSGLEHIRTLYDNLKHATESFSYGPMLGYRPVVDGKPGRFTFETYGQIGARVRHFGSGLILNDLIPEVDGMRMLAFFSKNCKQWVIAEYACYSFSGVTVPLYDTLGPDTVGYVLNQTKLTTVLCNGDREAQVIADVKKDCPAICAVVHINPLQAATLKACEDAGVKCYSFEEIEATGKGNPQQPRPPKPSDIATFCYTSGTTGDPKGALLSHQSMISTTNAAILAGVSPRSTDVHLSYLPLAHVFERQVQAFLIQNGGSIGFFQGDTRLILDDLKELRPTIFPSVPRLLNRVYDKIVAGASESPAKKVLFDMAVKAKQEKLAEGYLEHPLWDPVIFKPLVRRLGLDRVRVLITGSAPIAGHVLDFLRIMLRAPVVEGYGQTESCAGLTLTHPADLTTGHVGGPIPCCELRLADVPDMGYLASDTRHTDGTACAGRGEICFRGLCLFDGYYKMEEKTKEAIDADGWCHTGDIGIWLPSGQLRIVDRKKNLFKLSQGEYVAPEKIETVYLQSKLVAQAFVHGDSLHSCLVAVVVPDEEQVAVWAKQNNIPGDFAAICKSPKLKEAVLADMKTVAKEKGLHGFEQVKAIHIESELFSVENGLLTPTFKLKRNEAKIKYDGEVARMYEAVGDHVAGKSLHQK